MSKDKVKTQITNDIKLEAIDKHLKQLIVLQKDILLTLLLSKGGKNEDVTNFFRKHYVSCNAERVSSLKGMLKSKSLATKKKGNAKERKSIGE